MDAKKLEILMTAVDLGSFSKASEVVGYTQSGLTHLVDSLEREIGFPLIRRSYSGIALTEAGENLLPDIRQFLQANANLENQIQNTKNNFLFQSMIATGIIILLSSICTWFVTRRALTPLRRFSDKISQVQAQNLSEPLEVPLSEDEISRLTRSFNDMLARLDNAFSAQKQFVASAAHELRTPLAVMQTNLEVFYKKPEHAPQEYDRLFTMLQEQTGRLSHLAEILLDMTGLQTVERSDTISLAALTEEVFCDLDPVAEKHQVRLIQTDGDCTVTGSYILLYRAVYNLVENAIKYNRPSGSVTVSIHTAESAVLEVTDTGIGISPENQEKIFDPFYRVDKSRSRAMGGAGLGLALVSEIARQHNGQVKVTQSSEKGSTIALMLPVTLL